MSQGTACRCRPRAVEVLQRKSNRSAFNGYHWTASDWSSVRCRTCGAVWRTKARYVDRAPDAAR